MSLPLVSIVTPAYNEEKLLAECIESVLSQSYVHWDYLIVDNCSTDATATIARNYAAVDSRIRVITNAALIPAVRNINLGLRNISSESTYCKVVFADDILLPGCLDQMVGLMEAHSGVGITGAYGIDGQWVLWEGIPYFKNVVSGRDICRERLLGGPYVFGSATSVLFRSELVRNRDPFFDESIVHATDSDACFDILKKWDFGFVHQVLTFSRVREGSLLEASKSLNASAADTLREVFEYGPFYLDAPEFSRRFKEIVLSYYDFLAGSLRRRHSGEFWAFHKANLRNCGVHFSWLAVVQAIGRKILRRLRVTNDTPQRWGL